MPALTLRKQYLARFGTASMRFEWKTGREPSRADEVSYENMAALRMRLLFFADIIHHGSRDCTAETMCSQDRTGNQPDVCLEQHICFKAMSYTASIMIWY